MQYARVLNLNYRYNPEEGELTFEDGVKYSVWEALYLSRTRASEETIRAIHKIKGVFNAGIESPFGDLLDGKDHTKRNKCSHLCNDTGGNTIGHKRRKNKEGNGKKFYPEAVQEILSL
jgi:hypothetical protein